MQSLAGARQYVLLSGMIQRYLCTSGKPLKKLQEENRPKMLSSQTLAHFESLVPQVLQDPRRLPRMQTISDTNECLWGLPKTMTQGKLFRMGDGINTWNLVRRNYHAPLSVRSQQPDLGRKVKGEQILTRNDQTEFSKVFEQILKDVDELTYCKSAKGISPSIQEILEYTVSNGKNLRGLLVVISYKLFANELSKESIFRANVLGWCVEMVQAFALIVDDIMDQSVTRRGKRCWYLLQGNTAINDGLIVYESALQILRKYFGHEPYYMDLVDVLHESVFKATLGQNLDSRTSIKEGIEGFTRERYSDIVKNKTSIYTFCKPVFFGMILAGRKDLVENKEATEILADIGYLFQAQDDFLDCYGDSSISGKIGTDIQDGKCTWILVEALEVADENQRNIIQENYGTKDPLAVARVLAVFETLGVRERYRTFEAERRNKILSKIEQLPPEFPPQLYASILGLILGRNK